MDILLVMFVQDYLGGNRSLDRLQNLLMDITWDNEIQVRADTRALAEEIELRIAEFTSGHITEAVLKDLIAQATGLTPFVVNVDAPVSSRQSSVRMGANQQTQQVACA